MAYIHTIHESDATGELAEWYRRAGNPDGTVDNVMKIHSLNPDTLRTHFEMYRAALHGPSPLSRIEREIVGVVVSRLNGCNYCLIHHSKGLERLLPDERKSIADDLAHGRQRGFHLRGVVAVVIDQFGGTPRECYLAEPGKAPAHPGEPL